MVYTCVLSVIGCSLMTPFQTSATKLKQDYHYHCYYTVRNIVCTSMLFGSMKQRKFNYLPEVGFEAMNISLPGQCFIY